MGKIMATHIALTATHYFVMCSLGWWWVLGAEIDFAKMAVLAVLCGVGSLINAVIHQRVVKAARRQESE